MSVPFLELWEMTR